MKRRPERRLMCLCSSARFIETHKGCKGLVSKGCVRPCVCVCVFSLILFALPGGGHSAKNGGLKKKKGFEFILSSILLGAKNLEVGNGVRQTLDPGGEGGGNPPTHTHAHAPRTHLA